MEGVHRPAAAAVKLRCGRVDGRATFSARKVALGRVKLVVRAGPSLLSPLVLDDILLVVGELVISGLYENGRVQTGRVQLCGSWVMVSAAPLTFAKSADAA